MAVAVRAAKAVGRAGSPASRNLFKPAGGAGRPVAPHLHGIGACAAQHVYALVEDGTVGHPVKRDAVGLQGKGAWGRQGGKLGGRAREVDAMCSRQRRLMPHTRMDPQCTHHAILQQRCRPVGPHLEPRRQLLRLPQHIRLCCMDAAQQRHVRLEDRCTRGAACQPFDLGMQLFSQRPCEVERQSWVDGRRWLHHCCTSVGGGSGTRAA